MRLLVLIVIGSALWSPHAALAVPQQMTYEGYLTDLSDRPSDGVITIAFALYASEDDMENLWSETREGVEVRNGYFSLSLGDRNPLTGDLFARSELYLGITIDGAEILPRHPFASVAFARRAQQADDVLGRHIHPSAVSIGDQWVIDEEGRWVGDPTGLMGPAGPQGEVGARGEQGPQGIQGERGLPGDRGPQGVRGPQGERGVAGAEGAQGIRGATGDRGPQGDQGPQGIRGPEGERGLRGEEGLRGPTGPAGAVGATGARGPAGPAGATGARGPAGATGARGPAGPRGSTGARGATGAQGPAGPAGARGPTGPRGSTGARGATGAQGPAGSATYYERKQVGRGAISSTVRTNERYIVEVGPADVGRTIALDHAIMTRLCQDDDGCGYVVQMINWDNGQPGNVASRGPHRFFMSQTGGSHWWRFSDWDSAARDVDGSTGQVNSWDCYFGDAETATNTSNGRRDSAIGFGVLNCRGCDYNDARTTCRYVFTD